MSEVLDGMFVRELESPQIPSVPEMKTKLVQFNEGQLSTSSMNSVSRWVVEKQQWWG